MIPRASISIPSRSLKDLERRHGPVFTGLRTAVIAVAACTGVGAPAQRMRTLLKWMAVPDLAMAGEALRVRRAAWLVASSTTGLRDAGVQDIRRPRRQQCGMRAVKRSRLEHALARPGAE